MLVENALGERFHFLNQQNTALALEDFKRAGYLVQVAEAKAQLGIINAVVGECFQLIEGGLQTVFNLAYQPFKPGKGLYIFYLELLLTSLFIAAFAH